MGRAHATAQNMKKNTIFSRRLSAAPHFARLKTRVKLPIASQPTLSPN
jgi:hypothetical protein